MKKLLIVVLFFAILLAFPERSFAVEVEPGLIFGTIRFDGGRPENSGRKFSIGIKTDLIWEGRLEKVLGVRLSTIAEPTDCKDEILNDIFALSGRISYQLNPNDKTIISPFLGTELQQWRRNSSTKEELWGDLLFTEAVFGLGLERDNFYFEAGGLWPFWTHVDGGSRPNGELGFMLSGGVICKERIKLGLFYRQEKFEGDPDSKLDWYGLLITYRF